MAVRVAFLGCGKMARSHMSALERAKDARMVAFCDLNEEAAGSAASEYGGKVYSRFESMLAKERFDALWVCIPPSAHDGQEIAAAEKGIHLYVEKPVSLDLSRAKEVARAIQQAGVISAVGYQIRYCPHVDKARRLLRGRRANMVMGRYFCDMRGRGAPWWRKMAVSGGQIVEQATHAIDLMRYLGGDIRRVFATCALREAAAVKGWDVPDHSAAVVDFAGGAIGSVQSSASFSVGWESGVRIIGTDFSMDCTFDSLTLTDGAGTQHYKSEGDSLPLAHKAFLQSVEAGRHRGIRSRYADGVKTLAVTLAMNESAATGRAVAC
jgi:predicted dehydrogenase